MNTTEQRRQDLLARIKTGRPAGRTCEAYIDADGVERWRIPCIGGGYIYCTDKADADDMLQLLSSIEQRKAGATTKQD